MRICSLLAPSLRPKSLAANLQLFVGHYTRAHLIFLADRRVAATFRANSAGNGRRGVACPRWGRTVGPSSGIPTFSAEGRIGDHQIQFPSSSLPNRQKIEMRPALCEHQEPAESGISFSGLRSGLGRGGVQVKRRPKGRGMCPQMSPMGADEWTGEQNQYSRTMRPISPWLESIEII